MIRKASLLILICYVFLPTVLNSQIDWAPLDATWHYDHFNRAKSIAKLSVVKDTVINGFNCQIIDGNQQEQFITCVDQFLVYLYREGEFDTLYNFGAHIGDSWTIYDEVNPEDYTVYIKSTVIDTGELSIQDQNLSMYVVEIEENYVYGAPTETPWQDTVVERIGFLNNYLLPWDTNRSRYDAHVGGQLRCYADSEVSINKSHSPCDAINSESFIQSGLLGNSENASWVYNYNNGWSLNGFHKLEYGTDTIIGNKICKQLTRVQVHQDFARASKPVSKVNREPIIIFASEDLIEILNGETFDTLFYFNGNIGDSWTIEIEDDFTEKFSMKTTIDETGSIDIEGIDFDYYAVHYEFSGEAIETTPGWYRDTIVHDIGNISGYILPWHAPAFTVDTGDGGSFRCYHSDGFINYRKNPNEECELISSNYETEKIQSMSIYPNPATEKIHIEMNNKQINDYWFGIYTSDGALVKSISKLETQDIDVQDLADGIYVLTVVSKNSQMMTYNFLVQR